MWVILFFGNMGDFGQKEPSRMTILLSKIDKFTIKIQKSAKIFAYIKKKQYLCSRF